MFTKEPCRSSPLTRLTMQRPFAAYLSHKGIKVPHIIRVGSGLQSCNSLNCCPQQNGAPALSWGKTQHNQPTLAGGSHAAVAARRIVDPSRGARSKLNYFKDSADKSALCYRISSLLSSNASWPTSWRFQTSSDGENQGNVWMERRRPTKR